jgi:hypothetical protein
MNSGLEMSHSWPPASLFAVFSPKLWTVLNQYGTGGPLRDRRLWTATRYKVRRSIARGNFGAKTPSSVRDAISPLTAKALMTRKEPRATVFWR